jgi:1-acyl-sn-glycerol-3-phosphate acyltransferase
VPLRAAEPEPAATTHTPAPTPAPPPLRGSEGAGQGGPPSASTLTSALRVLLFLPIAWLGLQLQLLLLGLMSLTWNVTALLLYPLLPRATGLRVGRKMIAWGYGLFWRIARLSGMLRLEAGVLDALREERGLVVVANHPSLLDAVMLVARLPRCACIMKSSIARNPLLGPGAKLARYIRNDSAHSMVQGAVDDLKAGGQLLLFPEGTRTAPGLRDAKPPRLNSFHFSFTMIAQRAQVPIQTVFIDTDSPYLGKGWPLWKLPPLPIRFTVRLGQRFAPTTDHKALQAQIEAYFLAGLQPPGPAV